MAETKTDLGGPNPWRIDDPPTHLRVWGTDTRYPLPPGGEHHVIGSAADCWLQLHDERISRRHARLSYDHGRWTVFDLHSKNGVHHDGTRQASAALAPGSEIGLGGFTLIVDSPKLTALRDVVSRLLGWSDRQRPAVDLALRSVRLAAARRESLQLCGDGDLISVARLLHRATLGDDRPFVVCDPRRRRVDPNARAAGNYDSGIDALAAAAGGTLCIWQSRQPADFAQVIEAWRQPGAGVQLVVCTHALQPGDPLIAAPVVLPPLHERGAELGRIIDAYAVDAGAAPGGTLTAVERDWICQHEAETLSRIEKATARLVALRIASGSVTRAAAQLGMAHGALSEWIARRTFDYSDDDGDA